MDIKKIWKAVENNLKEPFKELGIKPEYAPHYVAEEEQSIPRITEKQGKVDFLEDEYNFWLPVHGTEYERVKVNYFLDGTVRTVHLMHFPSGNYHLPIHIAEIGAAVIERRTDGRVVPFSVKIEFLILLPLSFLTEAEKIERAREIIQERGTILADDVRIRLIDTCEGDTVGPGEDINKALEKDKGDYGYLRNRARARARNEMRKLEYQLLDEAIVSLGPRERFMIAVDGTITDLRDKRLKWCVGVSKTFNTKFLTAHQHAKVLRLGQNQRSVVFRFDPKKGVHLSERLSWYLRMRDPKGHDPTFGLLRLELSPFHATKKGGKIINFDKSLVDSLSWVLCLEKLPVAYPDPRWHNLLYPIKVCEEYLRAQFIPIAALREMPLPFEL